MQTRECEIGKHAQMDPIGKHFTGATNESAAHARGPAVLCASLASHQAEHIHRRPPRRLRKHLQHRVEMSDE